MLNLSNWKRFADEIKHVLGTTYSDKNYYSYTLSPFGDLCIDDTLI
jgi:hypothetical protein